MTPTEAALKRLQDAMGEGWDCEVSEHDDFSLFRVRCLHLDRNGLIDLELFGAWLPDRSGNPGILLSAWRDAIRPIVEKAVTETIVSLGMEDRIQADWNSSPKRVAARVLGEER